MTKFNSQLSGQKAKENWFNGFKNEYGIKTLPKIGTVQEIKIAQEKLDGKMLSCFDGAGSLKVNGKVVSKIKVYNGEIALPSKFSLTLSLHRISETNLRIKGDIQSIVKKK